MAEAKTKATEQSVDAFLDAVPDERRRRDCRTVLGMMRDATRVEPKMWGPSIVGFGRYTYKYDSGREGEWPVVGFSPRKTELTLYIMPGFDRYDELLARLGKHKLGKSCLYLKKLDDVDLDALRALIVESVAAMAPQRVE
jgi:hypothetical protein